MPPASPASGRDQLSRLVLVDSFGLSWNRPSPKFALPLLAYIARPTERTRDRFLAQCFVDFDRVRGQMGERFEPIGAYSLEWARTKTAKAALRSLMSVYGMQPIPRDTLARIPVPTAMIWGRHDLQTRLSVAEAASARYRWPLHVIEEARDDPFFEQPEAALPCPPCRARQLLTFAATRPTTQHEPSVMIATVRTPERRGRRRDAGCR